MLQRPIELALYLTSENTLGPRAGTEEEWKRLEGLAPQIAFVDARGVIWTRQGVEQPQRAPDFYLRGQARMQSQPWPPPEEPESTPASD